MNRRLLAAVVAGAAFSTLTAGPAWAPKIFGAVDSATGARCGDGTDTFTGPMWLGRFAADRNTLVVGVTVSGDCGDMVPDGTFEASGLVPVTYLSASSCDGIAYELGAAHLTRDKEGEKPLFIDLSGRTFVVSPEDDEDPTKLCRIARSGGRLGARATADLLNPQAPTNGGSSKT